MNKWLAKDEQGFTLVELMMVIVILAILTGVAVPMVSRMQKNAWKAKLTSLADSLGSAIVVDAMMAMDDAVTGAYYAG
ncbi:MAG: type II secretion system protein [Limnochordia bacterium]